MVMMKSPSCMGHTRGAERPQTQPDQLTHLPRAKNLPSMKQLEITAHCPKSLTINCILLGC